MKKVLYTVAIVAAISLAACGGKKNAEEAAAAPAAENVEVAEGEVTVEETPCCTEGEECTNEECNQEGECTKCTKECTEECNEATTEAAPEAQPEA